MRSRTIKTLTGISLAIFIAGCNPYESKLVCGKDTPFGSCASTPEIYQEIINEGKTQGDAAQNGEIVLDSCPECAKNGKALAPTVKHSVSSAYQEALLGKAASLLKKHSTPLAIPPTVGCIWFPPMLGESTDVVNMEQYVCMFLDKPRFIMGDYLMHKGE